MDATPTTTRVPKRIAKILLQALQGGVVPRVGLPYIAVGRKAEIEALLTDVDAVEAGGASCRFIVGSYGSGKSFLLQTIRTYVMDRGFVVADADLSPERRLQGTKGQGLATYRELMQNLATKTMPEGGALGLVLERWLSGMKTAAQTRHRLSIESPSFARALEADIVSWAMGLSELLHGAEFARILVAYARAHDAALDDPDAAQTQADVLKWLRGEFPTRQEAKAALGVNLVVTDENWYDFVKILSRFLTLAGYKGLFVMIDELVNLYKIPNSVSRSYNYEKLLTIYNDTLQGKARHLGFIFCGTPQSMEDRRRGIFSYEALRSRLASGRIGDSMGLTDMRSPVIKLNPLTINELLVLIEKLADIHAGCFGCARALTLAELTAFLHAEFDREGAATHITPREIIRDFIELLNLRAAHPDADWSALLARKTSAPPKDRAPEGEAALVEAGAENETFPPTAAARKDDFSGFDF